MTIGLVWAGGRLSAKNWATFMRAFTGNTCGGFDLFIGSSSCALLLLRRLRIAASP
jgi:hypothetical protein